MEALSANVQFQLEGFSVTCRITASLEECSVIRQREWKVRPPGEWFECWGHSLERERFPNARAWAQSPAPKRSSWECLIKF